MRTTLLDLLRFVVDAGNIQMRSQMRKALANAQGKTVLDVGCGLGLWCDFMEWDYTGIDIDQNYIQYARKKHQGKKFLVMDCTKMAFKDNSFHTVMVLDTLHHLDDEEVKRTMDEAKRVANGEVVVIDAIMARNPIQRFVMSHDQGKHIRRAEEMVKLTGMEPVEEFNSGLYHEATFSRTSETFEEYVSKELERQAKNLKRNGMEYKP